MDIRKRMPYPGHDKQEYPYDHCLQCPLANCPLRQYVQPCFVLRMIEARTGQVAA